MNYLIKNAKIFDKTSPWHLKQADLLIRKSRIEKIGKNLSDDKAKIISGKELCVSPGWLDIGTTLTEPGFEDLDDIHSLCASAMAGGFTALVVMPNTEPVIDNKSTIDSLKMRASAQLVDIYPVGALTRACNGTEISEMKDMAEAGAVAF